jgi:hypothetical protein
MKLLMGVTETSQCEILWMLAYSVYQLRSCVAVKCRVVDVIGESSDGEGDSPI